MGLIDSLLRHPRTPQQAMFGIAMGIALVCIGLLTFVAQIAFAWAGSETNDFTLLGLLAVLGGFLSVGLNREAYYRLGGTRP